MRCPTAKPLVDEFKAGAWRRPTSLEISTLRIAGGSVMGFLVRRGFSLLTIADIS
jgi:hypothetical protein